MGSSTEGAHAATLLLARHADAAYERPAIVSDEGGFLTEVGRTQAVDLAETLQDHGVDAVVTSTMRRAEQTGKIVADRLRVGVSSLDGLQEFSVGDLAGRCAGPEPRAVVYDWIEGRLDRSCPGGEDGHVVLRRFLSAIGAVARDAAGRRTLVVTHGGVLTMALAHLFPGLAPRIRGSHLPSCAVVPVGAHDGGWLLLGDWPGVVSR